MFKLLWVLKTSNERFIAAKMSKVRMKKILNVRFQFVCFFNSQLVKRRPITIKAKRMQSNPEANLKKEI